jgi:hypothetical protein
MAKVCNFPDIMISEARKIQRYLRSLSSVILVDTNPNQSAECITLILKKLSLIQDSTADESELISFLKEIHDEFVSMKEQILHFIAEECKEHATKIVFESSKS